jgi:hypothetical protein
MTEQNTLPGDAGQQPEPAVTAQPAEQFHLVTAMGG